MRQHAGLILFIGAMIIAAVTVGVLSQTIQDKQAAPDEITVGHPEITGVSLWNVSDRTAPYIRVTITGDGDPVPIEDTYLTLQTGSGQVDLDIRQ